MVVRTDKELGEGFAESKEWKSDASELYNFIEEVEVDGVKKIVVSSQSGHERNHLFSNSDEKGFVDVSLLSGLDSIADSRSNAIWDFDHDGRLDIALVNANNPFLQLFRNQNSSTDQKFVVVQLVGGNSTGMPSQDWSNRDGIGAVVSVITDDHQFVRESRAGEGFASQNSKDMLVGIGTATSGKIQIKWPSGKTTEHGTIDAGTRIRCYENASDSKDGAGQVVIDYRSSGFVAKPNTLFTGDVFGKERAAGKAKLSLFVSLATWCPECKKNQPQVRALAERFGESINLFAVPVDENDTGEKLKTYEEAFKPAYQILGDIEKAEVSKMQEIVTRVSEQGALPSTIVTDSQGRVVMVTGGVPTVSELARLLESLETSE